ncbi:MAG: HDOD domain-containing protein [Candidatus Polarisedimenticolaceae bacterium]|nr:HDOD domain-containing protein [Candidatus Polarisedimenticolaceae bacterium]
MMIPINLDDLDGLPALKPGVMKILHTINQDDVDITNIAKSIQRDIGMTAGVLRVANSSFYGRSNQIASVKEACVLLGKHTVRNLALSSAVLNHLTPSNDAAFDCKALWQHGLGTAAVSIVLAKQSDVDEGNAFTCGLLHDLGRVILAIHFPEHFSTVLNYQNDHHCLLQEAEMTVLGIDHAALGEELAKKWNFPNHICRVIGSHHQPEHAYKNNLPRLIHVADIISHGLELSSKEDNLIPSVDEESVKQLGLEWTHLRGLFKEIEETYHSFTSLLDAPNP